MTAGERAQRHASGWLRVIAAVAAGATLPLAFAPLEWFWLAPVAYAVLLYLWRDAASPREAFALGFSFGAGCFGAGTYWTYIAVREFGEAPIALAVALTVGLVLILALFPAAAGWCALRIFGAVAPREARAPLRSPVHLVATLPALWVLLEWLRGWVFSGFGWLSAGYSQTGSWLIGYAPVLGQHGLGWLVLLSAGSLLVLVIGTRRARLAAAATLAFVWLGGLALGTLEWTQPRDRPLSVALVQGAIAQDLKWRPEQLPGTLALYGRLTRESADSDLIVWPEAAIPTLYEYVEGYLEEVRHWAEQEGTSVMLGILRTSPSSGPVEPGEVPGFQNVLVALTDPLQIYVKRHLVPFGEYFPVPDFIRAWMRLMSLPYTDAEPGEPLQPPLDVAGERVAVTICYEDVFGAEQLHYFPDATLLVNVSNDAWFGDSIAPHQHLQIARLRAAEAGRYLLRATNTGITAVIDPRGRVVERVPQFEPAVLRYTVQGHTGATPYTRYGNYPVILVACVVLAAVRWRTRRA